MAGKAKVQYSLSVNSYNEPLCGGKLLFSINQKCIKQMPKILLLGVVASWSWCSLKMFQSEGHAHLEANANIVYLRIQFVTKWVF